MQRRLANLILLGAITALLASGVVAWLVPEAGAEPLLLAHRIAGVALVLALVWKYGIARRSLRRRTLRSGSVWLGLATGAAVVAASGLGLAWTLGLVSFDRPLAYSALSLHVIAGLTLGALVVGHALLRGERRPPLATLVTRRAALRGIGLLAASFVVAGVVDRFGLPRRVTGSRAAGSYTGNAFPETIWSLDAVPDVDVATWRLRVRGAVARPGALTYGELLSLPRQARPAILDCTGGWWTEQVWSGVSLQEVLASREVRADYTRVEVISVTGHRWSFDRDLAENAVLATHVGDEVLSVGHGYPLRLVMPTLRGFTWIKWVQDVVVA